MTPPVPARRLGIVPYLNVRPLLVGLEQQFPVADWVRATPRDLAAMLAAGTVDIAIVSVYEGLRAADRLRLLPGAVIGSNGAVRSVSLFSRVPLTQVRRVLLDRASLTSIHLARILARELLEIEPEYEHAEAPILPSLDWRALPHDAFVVIGDTALHWEHDFPHKLDLGEGWRQLTGLPFVFAAWWARHGVALTPDQESAFAAARVRGEGCIDKLVEEILAEGQSWPGGAPSLRQYLGEAINYRLGPRQLAALALFREKLMHHGLL